MKNPVVNRCLEDKAMDHIDHALGRPANPLMDTYREYFAVGSDTDLANAFRASPYWEEGVGTVPGKMAYFYVTFEGRQALDDHLKAIGSLHRAFLVTYDGYEDVVAAESHSKARYASYLKLSDVCPDLTFADFCKRSIVRVLP